MLTAKGFASYATCGNTGFAHLTDLASGPCDLCPKLRELKIMLEIGNRMLQTTVSFRAPALCGAIAWSWSHSCSRSRGVARSRICMHAQRAGGVSMDECEVSEIGVAR